MKIKISGAIFDMDGTLVDSLMVWDVLWDRFGERYGVKNFRPEYSVNKAVRTLTLKDAMELVHKTYSMGKDGGELLDVANRMIVDFYENDVKLKKGAKEFLDHCKENGVRMCIATATAPDLVSLAMKSCGLDKYIEKVFSCSDFGKGKDQPDVFLAAMEYLGTDLETTWVFEDSYVALSTANKVGFKTVGIYDQYNFDTEKLAALADVHIDENGSLEEII